MANSLKTPKETSKVIPYGPVGGIFGKNSWKNSRENFQEYADENLEQWSEFQGKLLKRIFRGFLAFSRFFLQFRNYLWIYLCKLQTFQNSLNILGIYFHFILFLIRIASGISLKILLILWKLAPCRSLICCPSLQLFPQKLFWLVDWWSKTFFVHVSNICFGNFFRSYFGICLRKSSEIPLSIPAIIYLFISSATPLK